MNAHTILVRARALIATPDRWVQGSMARTKYGTEVMVGDAAAACFCTAGAIHRVEIEVYRQHGADVGTAAVSGAASAIRKALIAREGDDTSIVVFNDRPTTTHAEILSVFDAAIEAEAPRP